MPYSWADRADMARTEEREAHFFGPCDNPWCKRERCFILHDEQFQADWLDAIDEDEERFPRIEDDSWPDDRKDYDGPDCGEYNFQRGDYHGIR